MTRDYGLEDEAREGRFAHDEMVHAAYAQLIGLCRGILADNVLSNEEIVALDQWLEAYEARLPEWPAKVLTRRIKQVLRDGYVDEDERADLTELVARAAGGQGPEGFDVPTTLPLTDPPPHIDYLDRRFCLTGTFLYGPRREVESVIQEWGGTVVQGTNRAHYLVIGATITPAWKYTSHGLKIEKALKAIEAGKPIAIVSEEHWSSTLC